MSSPPSQRVLPPGTVVAGKLRVVRQLGVGGMGTVYEVEHELTKHRRALKILHPRVSQSPTVVTRFVREASAAARIGNAHIAETFDAGRLDSGEPYLLMELLVGETLDQRLQRLGTLNPGELAELIGQACDGIQAAHEAGIVHRDLKPENLFVTARDGAAFLKILDFGISKFDAERTGSLGVTTEGTLVGTPFYMPPEQVRGETSLDARADVYSLGVILYECACGVRPYDAQALEHLAVLIHEGKAVPLAERRPELTREFCSVVHRAMAVEREQRYPSAKALGEALGPLRAGAAVHRSPLASDPPRVVIRTSRPPAAKDGAAVSAVAASSVTETALADTLGTPGQARRSNVGLLVAGLAAILVGAVALTVMRGSRGHSPTGATAVTVTAEAEPSAPTAALAPMPVSLASAEALPDASPARGTPSVRPVGPGPSAAASTRAPSAATAPAATSTSKTRVDQNGLAGENPFR
jgi:serine/threonine-protein kinase